MVAQDPSVQCRHRDIDAGRSEVGDEDMPGVGAEGQLARRTPARARSGVALAHEPTLDQLTDPLCHDRSTETRPRDELRPR